MKTCRTCGAEILWAKTEAGRSIPLDPTPRDDGNLAVSSAPGGLLARDVRRVSPALIAGLPRHVSHFASCPQASGHRRR